MTGNVALQNSGARRTIWADAEPFLRGIVESGVLLLLATAIEKLFFGAGYYASLVQHPFWIIVLLAVLQHGLFVGVATAGLAALMMDWPVRPVGVDITAHYVEIAILPLQWLLAAVCIGVFRQAEISREKNLVTEAQHLRDMNEALAAEVHRIDTLLEHTELGAVTQSGGLHTTPPLLEGLIALHKAPREDLPALFGSVARQCSPLESYLILEDETEHRDAAHHIADAGHAPTGLTGGKGFSQNLRNTVAQFGEAPLWSSDPPDRFVLVTPLAGHHGEPSPGAVCFVAEREVDAVTTRGIAELLSTIVESALEREDSALGADRRSATPFNTMTGTEAPDA